MSASPEGAGQRVRNPCVRLCTLDDRDICMGCHRSLEEICAWHGMSDDERLGVLERARERAATRPRRGAP